jgi:hypothetical protein
MRGAITPLPHKSAWRGAYLSTRDNFTFATIYLPGV